MWEVLDTIEISKAPEPKVELMLDNFKPNPGFTYVGRTVFVRMPNATEFMSTIVDFKQHVDTCSFVLPLTSALVPPGSYVRFLSNGVNVE